MLTIHTCTYKTVTHRQLFQYQISSFFSICSRRATSANTIFTSLPPFSTYRIECSATPRPPELFSCSQTPTLHFPFTTRAHRNLPLVNPSINDDYLKTRHALRHVMADVITLRSFSVISGQLRDNFVSRNDRRAEENSQSS